MPDHRKLKSYVWHKGKCYFVSTIERESSAVELPVTRFHETMAWAYNWDTTERGKIVAQVGSSEAFEQHYRVCKELFTHGEYKEIGD